MHKGADDVIPRQSGIKSIRDLPKALRVLLTNLTFIFVSFGGASDGESIRMDMLKPTVVEHFV